MLIFSTGRGAIFITIFVFETLQIKLVFPAEFDASIYFLWAADTQGRATSRKETTWEEGSTKTAKQSWMDN
jgi:hypothetical protein